VLTKDYEIVRIRIALLSGRNFETKQFKEVIAEESFGKLKSRVARRWYAMSTLRERYTGSPETAFDFDMRPVGTRGLAAYVEASIESELSESFIMIDTSFNMLSDANGGDTDTTSPTLRKYHTLLWRKCLPNGELFDLRDGIHGYYLFYSSPSEDFSLGSDAVTHAYKNQKKKKWLTTQIPEVVQDRSICGQ